MNEMKKGFLNETDNEAYQIGASTFERLLIDLKRENQNDSAASSDGDRKNVEDALSNAVTAYLHNNICNHLSLADICNHFNISKSCLCRVFKHGTGKSVVDYFIDIKIIEAKRLIRLGELNFTQIAEKLGYASIHHFSRSFKSKTGMSPGSYEKSIT